MMDDPHSQPTASKKQRMIAHYEEYHRDATNRRLHFICVPLIALSLIGMLWCIKIPLNQAAEYSITPNVGGIFIAGVLIYYLRLSLISFLGMLVFALVGCILCISVDASPLSLFYLSLGVFVVAWLGQFIGHKIEGRRPAFIEDLEFLLVSPAWLIDALFEKPIRGWMVTILVLLITFVIADQLYRWKPAVDFSNSTIQAEKYDVQIARDRWGVPHILGRTTADTAFGLAYAHAEDDFLTIQQVVLAVRGKLASVEGLATAANDYYVHLAGIWDDLDDRYVRLDPEVQGVCNAYADGLNYFASQHQELLVRHVWPVRGQDIMAGFIHKLPLMFGLHNDIGKLLTADSESSGTASVINPDRLPTGSNFIAVGPPRSEDKATRVCINSHQPWTGPVAWYEAHLISEQGANVYGGLFPGSPVVLLGHNADLAWGHTVNSPDLVDVFKLEMHAQDPLQYKVDGQWHTLQRRLVPIEVKLWRDFRWTVNREMLVSLFGPAIRVGEQVYAIRYAGMEKFRQVEQWFRMGQSRNLAEFKSAMRIHALAMFNTGYGDREGNLFYVYNALLPRRVTGVNWQDVVAGNRRDLAWTEYVPFDELPQVENPASGFIQNCNSSPFQSTVGSGNPLESGFTTDFGIETDLTNRARRALKLYGGDASITRQEFIQYKYDKTYSAESDLQRLVNTFLEHLSETESSLKEEVNLIRTWDGNMDKENRSSALVLLTFLPGIRNLEDGYDHQKTMQQLRETSARLRQHFGRIDVPWGEVNRIVQGDKDLPLGGGPDTLRAVYGRPQPDGTLQGRAGDCFFQFVEWDPSGQLQAWAINQFGSRPGHPDSPHFSDQVPMFAAEKMRATHFTREQVLAHAVRIYRP